MVVVVVVVVLAKVMKCSSLAHLPLSHLLWRCRIGVMHKLCTECPGLQKGYATPDLSVRLLIMSRPCS